MIAVTVKELKNFLDWRIKHNAVDATTACKILGIRKPSLLAMIDRNDIKGRMWENRWWFAMSEVEKNIVPPGAVKTGRPRSGNSRRAV